MPKGEFTGEPMGLIAQPGHLHERHFPMTLYINGVEHLTIKEGAERSGRHHDTIKRRVERRDFPNAFQGQDRNRSWLIPTPDFVAVGLLEHSRRNKQDPSAIVSIPQQPGKPNSPIPPSMREEIGVDCNQVIDLVQRLAQEDTELAAARACADERLATITLLSGLISGGVR